MTDKELESLWKQINLEEFWLKVEQGMAEGIEAYRQARAKAKGGLI